MTRCFVYVISVFAMALSALADESVPPMAGEGRTSTVEAVVRNLGPETKAKDLAPLRSDPLYAVRLLATQLRPISVTRIPGSKQDHYRQEMRVIWSVRALQYLTGLDFTAKTKHRYAIGDEEDRSRFLRLTRENEVAFFGVWMSRDSIFVAPKDAQRLVIDKWRAWVRVKAATHIFGEPDSIDKWYF
jgi:hypothetical protein